MNIRIFFRVDDKLRSKFPDLLFNLKCCSKLNQWCRCKSCVYCICITIYLFLS